MEKKSRKSASKWSQASERALIAVWGDKMGELRGCRKNSHILIEMVAELQKQGLSYTLDELQTKMHNLGARYRKEKQKIGSTGGSPSEWDLFPEMRALLAPFKSYHYENLVQDSMNNMNGIIEVFSPLPSTSNAYPSEFTSSPLASPSVPSPSTSTYITSPLASPSLSTPSISNSSMTSSMSPPSPLPSSSKAKKKHKDTLFILLKKIEENIEKSQDYMKKTSQKILQLEEEKKNILKEYVDREAEVQKALVEFLKRQ